MAGVAGIEPAYNGVKFRCLTSWLHSYIDRAVQFSSKASADLQTNLIHLT